jgi:twinkle protein
MSNHLIQWLTEDRKLDGALLAHMGVKVVDHPGLGEAIAFPYQRGGEPYAAKFRSLPKEWRSSQGVTRGLYNEDVLRGEITQPVVITEGEIDCLSCIQSGYPNTVSLPDGWTEEGNKTGPILEFEDALRRSPYIIVAGDNDRAGESLPRAVANLFSDHDVRYAEWPAGCKDANDVLSLHGEGELAKALNSAKRIDPPGGLISGFTDMPPMSQRRVLKTGMRELDWRVALELGAMSVVTGIPGHGKSTMTTFLANRIAKNENIKVGFMAFETHAHQIRDHLTRLLTGRPFDELSPRDQEGVAMELDGYFNIVHRTYEDDVSHHLGWLSSMVHALANRHGCKLIIIDPWNELEHMPEPGESLTNYINFALQKIRQWAEKLEIHICVVAHPKKIDANFSRAPGGYDVADSAAFYNKPSLGLTVHNAETDDGLKVVELHNWKTRNVQLYASEKGVTQLHFDPVRMAYEPFEKLEDAT